MDTLIAPQPKAVEIPSLDFEEEMVREHCDLARKLGVNYVKPRISTERLALLKFLNEEHIETFDLASVERWMDSKGDWAWLPMRECDAWSVNNSRTLYITRSNGKDMTNPLHAGRYREVIPTPILLIAEKIADHFGSAVSLLVAAPVDKRVFDPFLGVRLVNDTHTDPIVVARWDEPGYRMNPA